MTIKYIIHPEYVVSKSDGQSHYISYSELIYLYELNPKECIRYQEGNFNLKDIKDAVHLYPLYQGNYLEFKSEIK